MTGTDPPREPRLPRGRPQRARTLRTIMALVLREMSTTYGRSPGGYLWVILEPVAGVALFTLVMVVGLRIRTPMLGISFPLFYATGMLCMLLFNKTSNAVANALNFSSSLLFYPGVTYLDAILARFFLALMTQLLVAYLVLSGIVILMETRAVLDLGSVVEALALVALLGFGVGSLNAVLFPLFPLWETVWSILTFPLFLISSILYTYESLPPIGKEVLWYNPIVHVVGIMRRGFYPTYDATWASPLYVLGVSLVLLAAGMFFLRRYHRDILNI